MNRWRKVVICDTLRGMRMLSIKDPKELRPALHAHIDHCSDEELEAMRLALLDLELKRLTAEIGAEAEQDRLAGKHDPALVEATILAHRAKHPYR